MSMNQPKSHRPPSMTSQARWLITTILGALLALVYPLSVVGQEVDIYFVHSDHLGTPQKLTDESGAVVWSADYQPFGDVSLQASTVISNIRFPGQYFDAETGLHYNYFRNYEPTTGRYLESDPIGLLAGFNTYAYVHNDPLNYTDPYGLVTCRPGTPSIQCKINEIVANGRIDRLDELEELLEAQGIGGKEKLKLIRACKNAFNKKAKKAKREFRTNKEFKDFVHRNYKPDIKGAGKRDNPDLTAEELVDALEEFASLK